MLKKENFSREHIMRLRDNSRCDPLILERSVYAFGLLESLARVEMPFIFKGGTCLMLLLKDLRRLSTDIDIIVRPGTDIDRFIESASRIFPFEEVEEQRRIGKNGIEKKHYKFYYNSPMNERRFHILLDVVFEENHYSAIEKKKITSDILLTEEPYHEIFVPGIDCLLGDKMTAFAPHTIGIPYGRNKEMEIIKQLYDISSLIQVCENFTATYETYLETAKVEIAYRGNEYSLEDCLWDTIDTAACVAFRGKVMSEEYALLSSGIKSIAGHIYRGRYSGESAALDACSVMYLATCLLKNQAFHRIDNPESYKDATLENPKYAGLSHIKRMSLESYGYLVEAVEILNRL